MPTQLELACIRITELENQIEECHLLIDKVMDNRSTELSLEGDELPYRVRELVETFEYIQNESIETRNKLDNVRKMFDPIIDLFDLYE